MNIKHYWKIIFPILSIVATAYSVIHLKNIGVGNTDILFACGLGIIVTVALIDYSLKP
jgi:hypothetical protein